MFIREFRGTDLKQVVEVWNAAMPYNSVSSKLLIKNILLDVNFDPKGFLVSEKDGEINGFIYAVKRKIPIDARAGLESDTGWICAVGLKDKTDVNGGLGAELINAAEKLLCENGAKQIKACGYTPNYFYQGINTKYPEYMELFLSCGYSEEAVSVSRSIDLISYKTDDEIKELKKKRIGEGFLFTPLKDEYLLSFLSFTSPGWTHRFRRLINESFDYERVRLIICNDEVIGANVFGDPNSTIERFGPFGVNEAFRGKGLGKILLTDCLEAMKCRGMYCSYMQWSEKDNVASKLYDKIGFKVMHEYVSYEKELRK